MIPTLLLDWRLWLTLGFAGLLVWVSIERSRVASKTAELAAAAAARDAALNANVGLADAIDRLNAFHARAIETIAADQKRALERAKTAAAIKGKIHAAPASDDGPVAPVLWGFVDGLRDLRAGGGLPRQAGPAGDPRTAPGVPARP